MRRRRDEVSCASSPFSLVKDASRSAQPTKFEALAVTIRWSSLESIGSHCGRTLWAIPLRAHGILQAGRSRPRYASGATGIGKRENGSRPEAISEIARLRRSLPEPDRSDQHQECSTTDNRGYRRLDDLRVDHDLFRLIAERSPSPSAAWHSKGRAQTESHSAPTPPERVTGRLAVRLALQAVENRVHLSEPVLRVSVSLYTDPPSAGPEAVRRGRDHSNV